MPSIRHHLSHAPQIPRLSTPEQAVSLDVAYVITPVGTILSAPGIVVEKRPSVEWNLVPCHMGRVSTMHVWHVATSHTKIALGEVSSERRGDADSCRLFLQGGDWMCGGPSVSLGHTKSLHISFVVFFLSERRGAMERSNYSSLIGTERSIDFSLLS